MQSCLSLFPTESSGDWAAQMETFPNTHWPNFSVWRPSPSCSLQHNICLSDWNLLVKYLTDHTSLEFRLCTSIYSSDYTCALANQICYAPFGDLHNKCTVVVMCNLISCASMCLCACVLLKLMALGTYGMYNLGNHPWPLIALITLVISTEPHPHKWRVCAVVGGSCGGVWLWGSMISRWHCCFTGFLWTLISLL